MRHIDPNHPYPNLGQLFVFEQGDDYKAHQSRSLAEISNVSFYDLTDVLGPPTISHSSTPNGKVNREWRIKYVPKDCEGTTDHYLFAIYDWKAESAWEAENKLREWTIGGESGSGQIADELSQLVSQLVAIKEL